MSCISRRYGGMIAGIGGGIRDPKCRGKINGIDHRRNLGGDRAFGVRGKKKPSASAEGSMNMAPTYSPRTHPSTIGHKGLNFSVRNGKR